MSKTATSRVPVLAVCVLSLMSGYATANTEKPNTKQFDIPAGDLSTALLRLANETGAALVFQPEQTWGLATQGVHGVLTTQQAVTQLLMGTKLRLVVQDTGALQITTPGAHAIFVADAPEVNQAGPPVSASANSASSSDAPVEEVVVTGSRIARRDFTALTPIVTVDSSTFDNRSDIGVESALEQLPQFRASGDSSNLSPSGTPFPSPTAAPGAATVDLRGLGVNRTLVLVDGRRVQPVNALLTVDLNTIPSVAIDTVETITGGAASTYGADAISGVVNFKLKQNFQGVMVDAQQGISEHGDDSETSVSALLGGNFADAKGNLMLALNYSKRGQVWSDNRSWVRAGWNDPGTLGGSTGNTGDPLASSPLSAYVIDSANAPTGPAAFLPSNETTYWIDQHGNLFDVQNPLNPAHPYSGALGGSSGYKINAVGGALAYATESIATLGVPLTRWSALMTGHYAFNDHVSAFTEATFTSSQTQSVGSYSPLSSLWAVNVPYNPLYDDPNSPTFGNGPVGTAYHPVPAQLAALLNSRPDPSATWEYNGGTDYFGPYTTDTTSDVFQVTTGLRGDVPGTDWTWEVYGSHGESHILTQLNGFPTLDRLQDLFSASQYGAGWQNSFPIAVGGSCTSGLPIFNPDGSVNNRPSVSANCAAYADPTLNNVTDLTQSVYEGDIQGALFQMPFLNSGQLRYALGADYRSEDFSFTPDSDYTAYQDYPEVANNISLPVAVSGKTGVSEVYTEFSIPLARDLPFAKSIEIDPGFRFSHYDASAPDQSASGGNVDTWKLLGNWKVVDWVSFRGGIEVANRAPNVAELFTPVGGSGIASGGDPCAAYAVTPNWGNSASNPNRYNVQALCQYLITRDGGPASIMVPGASANNYQYDVFGYSPTAYGYQLSVTQGNPNLKSETARTVTGGVVFDSPFNNPWTQRMHLSVDWYQIQLDGAIGIPAVGTVYQECLDPHYNNLVGSAPGAYTGAQMAAANPYCALIEREYSPAAGDPYGAPRQYKAQYINQGGIQSRGIDLELDWGLRFSDVDLFKGIPGGINVNILGSYLDRYALSPFPGAAYINYTGTTVNSSFRYKLFSTFGYSVGPASLGFRWQHLPAAGPDPTTASTGTLGVGSHNQVDLFARWSLNDTLELRAGIDNLLDAWPEWVGANAQNNAVGTTTEDYDTIGRRFYLGVKANF